MQKINSKETELVEKTLGALLERTLKLEDEVNHLEEIEKYSNKLGTLNFQLNNFRGGKR